MSHLRRVVLGVIAAALLIVALCTGLFATFGNFSPKGHRIATDLVPATPRVEKPRTIELAKYGSATPITFSASFSFRANALVDNENITTLSSAGTQLWRLQITPLIDGTRDLVLSDTGSSPNTEITAVLASHVRNRRTYDVAITLHSDGWITTNVNGDEPFSYDLSPTSPLLRPTTVTIGAGLDGIHRFDGFVGAVTLDEESPGATSSAQHTLQIVTIVLVGLASMILFVLGAMWLLIERKAREHAGPLWQPKMLLVVGLVAIAVGVALVEYATPVDNVILTKTGSQQIDPWTLPYGQVSSYELGTEPQLFSQSSALDVDLAFQFRVGALPGPSGAEILRLGEGPEDLQLNVAQNGFFTGNYPLRPINQVWPIAFGSLVPGHWESVEVIETRDRTLELHFNGELVESYTFNAPEWTIVPSELNLGVPASTAEIAIRHVTLNVIDYGPSHNTPGALRTRIIELLGFLLIAIGTILLSSRLFYKIVPRISACSKRLVEIIVTVAGLGLVADIAYLVGGHQTNVYYSNSTWLFSLNARFSDFFQTLGILISRDPYGVQNASYPPFGYLMLEPVVWMARYAALICVLAVFVGFFVWWLIRALGSGLNTAWSIGLIVVMFFSLPVTFALDRANTDLIVLIFLILGGFALEQGRKPLSAALLALVAAAKILPIAYLAVFLHWRRLRYLIFGIVVAGAVTVFSFFAFSGTLTGQIDALRSANGIVNSSNQSAVTSTPFNTSITGFIQAIGFAIGGSSTGQAVTNHAQNYVRVEQIVGAVLVAVYLLFFERCEWRAMTVITCALLLFQDVSGDYSLLYVFAPLALFARSAPLNKRTITIAVLFGLVMMPKTYAFFGVGPYVDSSVLTTAPLLFALGLATIWDRVCDRTRQTQERLATPSNDAAASASPQTAWLSALVARVARSSGG